ncbi:hypothetical protein CASFOL_002342 [Castilleja foliolosa]|uniref:Uncharacterized protein n=1 Tax=Castilleja foliolosa TaxID=1961234 RepID=A0ABD3EHH8_9LAMI
MKMDKVTASFLVLFALIFASVSSSMEKERCVSGGHGVCNRFFTDVECDAKCKQIWPSLNSKGICLEPSGPIHLRLCVCNRDC